MPKRIVLNKNDLYTSVCILRMPSGLAGILFCLQLAVDGVVDAKYQLLQLGLKITICKAQAAVVKKVDHSIHWIMQLVFLANTYPQDKRCIAYA